METLLVSPKDNKELKLIEALFSKMKVKTRILSLEEKEDIYLAEMMKNADKTKKVSRDTIIKKLRK